MNLEQKLKDLEPALMAAARTIAKASAENDTDDLFQVMVLAILTKNDEDPEFLNQTDWYVCRFASFAARHAVRKERNYLKYVEPEGSLFPYPVADEDPENYSMADFVPESTPTPETQTIQAEALAEIAQIVMSLPEENRTVIKMLTSGYSQTEIAKILGKSKAVISRRASKAVKVLAESGLQDCFHN